MKIRGWTSSPDCDNLESKGNSVLTSYNVTTQSLSDSSSKNKSFLLNCCPLDVNFFPAFPEFAKTNISFWCECLPLPPPLPHTHDRFIAVHAAPLYAYPPSPRHANVKYNIVYANA